MNQILKSIFNIKTYEEEYNNLQDDFGVVARAYAETKATNNVLAKEVIKLENELSQLKTDPEKYVEEQVEQRTCLKEAELEERLKHRWKSEGRQEAFFDMGIRNIEAHERGNILVQLPDGEIVEMILGMEDVKEEPERAEFYADGVYYYIDEPESATDLDSIKIDDLLDDVTIDNLEDVV